MSAEANKILVRKLIDEALNQHSLAIVDELVAPDFAGHFLDGSPDINGRAGFKGWIAAVFEAMPDWRATEDDMIAEGDRVVFRWTVRATPREQPGGPAPAAQPPAGVPITVQGIGICRYAGGRLTELWHCQAAA